MPVIAVAGGTAGIGRTFVEEIIATGKHEVVILSRQRDPELEITIGARILSTDYASVEILAHLLEDNKIHTVISALSFRNQGNTPPDVQLVLAADASKTTKRYIANNWGVPIKEGDEVRMAPMAFKVEALKAAKQAKDLEYVSFYTGFFLDYWGMPVVKSHMRPAVMVIDIAHGAAAIPGDGNTPVAFTHTSDVARYVSAALDLEKWESGYNLSADKVTWKKFLALAENACGTEFKVTYDDAEKLKAGQVTELPTQVNAGLFATEDAYRKLLAATHLRMDSGMFDFDEGRKARDAFPSITPKTVKSLLEEAWGRA
ncbi:NAD(P)-binding protein [Xylariaceae sp. FL0016]|nr:NAD(P)-binding protein [Xylariaceae sp. FL0016]